MSKHLNNQLKPFGIGLGCSVLLIALYQYSPLHMAGITLAYLVMCYALFASMLVAFVAQEVGSSFFREIMERKWLFTALICLCVFLIVNDYSQDDATYRLVTSLIYGLVMFHGAFLVKGDKKYVTSSFLLVALFFISPTMDQNDPYGPHFQLRVVFWLLLGHMVFRWFFEQWRTMKTLKHEAAHAQLRHLKSQINPHFLFNTLNNIYGLALEKSDETPDMIMRLSELMRYTIYQGDKECVPISAEISYLENYLALQQVRLQNRGDVRFTHDVNAEYELAPLLLIMLVENAFKHGLETMREAAYIAIDLRVSDNRLHFKVENNRQEQPGISGVGLTNLRKRLELIYPDRHNLKVAQTSTMYTVDLEIQLEV